ncbi:hypothetical protein HMPREF0973_00974 [Prevotella veroralis F0319]|uniref:Uncharacterized protein n=1 Tax=Prevotella veroralis F0319 TaxID=649761 RepID=C9MMY9_9BACT|nr:hypothetical protein HMPREF0973_00974 [Prevotella veroralis F0319]
MKEPFNPVETISFKMNYRLLTFLKKVFKSFDSNGKSSTFVLGKL